ncbi:response regulator [Leptolyngbya sp. AN02str]|uniref:response regulator n=1 Tax=Leptolyngbya sp. AN02str TaxID=3423363 RepID=UPI003D318253
MRILLIDDDELLTQRLYDFLTSQSYAVDIAQDGEAGWDYTQAASYDLIVLDITLPKLDGVRLCRRLRQNNYSSPILLLTAKGESSDKVVGLDAGADDYLVKPCTLEELSARIRALLRRPKTAATPVLEWDGLSMDLSTCEVSYQGQVLPLSPKEYSLLELFLRNPQRVFSSSTILEHLWGFGDAPGEETIRTHIKRLRRKLKSVGIETMIDTVYGMGYRLQTPPPLPTPTPPSKEDQARAAAIALWEKFKSPILERMASLDKVAALLQSGNLSPELRQAAVEDAHKLSGSLGMFGFPEGSRLAKELEFSLRDATNPAQMEKLQPLVAALHQELEKTPHVSGMELLQALDDEPSSLPIAPKPMPLLERSATPEFKILAVDDDPIILKTLQYLLPRWGLNLVALNNPLQLWDALVSEKPDLLILDVDMPQENGIEICRLIRNNDDWSGLPILFLTAHRNPDIIVQLYSAGADDYVAKPFTEPEVITRIFNRLNRHQLAQRWQKPTA